MQGWPSLSLYKVGLRIGDDMGGSIDPLDANETPYKILEINYRIAGNLVGQNFGEWPKADVLANLILAAWA